MEKVILTEEEEKLTKYCKDFCPIHYAIEQYNKGNRHIISCSNEMCDRITNTFVLNLREKQKDKE